MMLIAPISHLRSNSTFQCRLESDLVSPKSVSAPNIVSALRKVCSQNRISSPALHNLRSHINPRLHSLSRVPKYRSTLDTDIHYSIKRQTPETERKLALLSKVVRLITRAEVVRLITRAEVVRLMTRAEDSRALL